eukprot:GFUD01091625.1.p1 GENE.GFUD01091625.1~~GFUD01091625.1.p1  ORF type:complete len:153 (-),score=41.25 GFUD01091625.1:22-456(-)
MAPVIRNLQGDTPSQRKEFRAKEKVRIETLQAGLEESLSRSRENQPEKTTVVRPAMVKRDSAMEPLRRPTIGGQSDGTDSSRPESVTSAIQAWGVGVDRSTDINTTRDTLEIDFDTTKDTLDGVDTTADTIDFRLRRPSGLGKM